jgi:hypothetical protein
MKNAKMLRVKRVEYDVERHQEVNKRCIDYKVKNILYFIYISNQGS